VEEIINGVFQLWSEVELGDKLASSAYELVKAEYSWEAVGQRVEKALVALF
jgi:glycosyltransferase involved in cell wall biosynthesis